MTKNLISYLFFLTTLLTLSCEESHTNTVDESQKGYQNTIDREIVNFQELESKITQDNDVLYVVNFWATWCIPCVEELPHFIELNESYKDQLFNMTFVTLDKASEFESRVLPFVEERKMDADVFLLDDVKNMNSWIKKVNTEWSGAIPATAFYKNGKQLYFKEGQLSKEELELFINKYL